MSESAKLLPVERLADIREQLAYWRKQLLEPEDQVCLRFEDLDGLLGHIDAQAKRNVVLEKLLAEWPTGLSWRNVVMAKEDQCASKRE